jgi:hypothetical protein
MKFHATIVDAAGATRTIEHDSRYDATAVLESEINATLGAGESIKLVGSPHERGAPSKRTQVPAIVRVA